MPEQALSQSQGGNVDLLGAMRTLLAAAKLRAYKSSFTPTPAKVQADFVAAEADFTGYPAGGATVAWSPVGTDPTFIATMIGSRTFFQATDAVSPNTIGGIWIESAGGTVEWYCEFDAPVPMEVALAFFAVTPLVTYPGIGSISLES